jgi:Uroporphyrinogen-III decarboxylase
MTSKERFARMYAHKEADRVPIIDGPWAGTIRRWRREGMPNDDWVSYFGVDSLVGIGCDISPRFECKVLEETDRYVISTTPWGQTLKQFKEEDSSPEFIDCKINTPEAWEIAKARMTPTDDRIPWDWLKANFHRLNADYFTQAGFWFGFDVTHSWMVGTETLLVAMYEEPDWVRDMFDTYLDMCIALFTKIWDAGYHFDCISWPDDMGYKGTTFFSNDMYRKILKPVHKRAIDWAHEHGIKAHMHSCGNVMTRIDDLIDIGLDALNPLEVKAGMEPLTLKAKYGDKLVLHGGINAVLWDNREAIIAEIDRLVPVLKQNGGYIFSSDHSIPNSVSLENFRAIIAEVKHVGTY